MDDVYQIVARQQVICGCHVHVGIDDPDLADRGHEPGPPVAAGRCSRCRPTRRSGRASTPASTATGCRCGSGGRRRACRPTSSDREEYDELVDDLTRSTPSRTPPSSTGTCGRPSGTRPLEFRISDVCLDVDDTVALAGLVRALVWTCAIEALEGREAPDLRPEVMESSVWRAARYGLAIRSGVAGVDDDRAGRSRRRRAARLRRRGPPLPRRPGPRPASGRVDPLGGQRCHPASVGRPPNPTS